MNENLLVLIMDKEAKGKTRELKKSLFRQSGEISLFSIPPVIILGRTEKKGFERKSWKHCISFTTDNALMTDFGYVLNESGTLSSIQKELSLDIRPAGLYISAAPVPFTSCMHINASKLRLAMLKCTEYGYQLLQ